MKTTRAISHGVLAAAVSCAMLFTAGIAVAADPPKDRAHDMHDMTAAKASDQPVSDSWITTKVKADMMEDTDVAASDIKVETSNGVVKLSGHVDTKAQQDKAVALTKGIKGVRKVDSASLMVGR